MDDEKEHARQQRYRERLRRARDIAAGLEDRVLVLESQVEAVSTALGAALGRAIASEEKRLAE